MTQEEIKQIVEEIEKTHDTRILYAVTSNLIMHSVTLVGINADVYRIQKYGTLKWAMARTNEINDWLNRRLKEQDGSE